MGHGFDNSMGVTHQWLTSRICLVRMGPDHYVYGDPYTGSCVGVVSYRRKVCIQGLAGAVGYRLLRDVERSFSDKGFGTEWTRIRNMDAEIRMTVTINGIERTVLSQKLSSKNELIDYQAAVMNAIIEFAAAQKDPEIPNVG